MSDTGKMGSAGRAAVGAQEGMAWLQHRKMTSAVHVCLWSISM